MKKLFVILFAWAAFVFTGCGHFQEKENKDADGGWRYPALCCNH